MAPVSLWQQWRLSWQFRPFLGLAFFTAAGAAAGLHFALAAAQHASTPLVRGPSILLTPLLPALGFVLLAIYEKNVRRLFCGLAVFCAMSGYAAWRVLPPPGDISLLTRIRAPAGPIPKVVLTVRGIVAGDPRRSELSTHFPLQCVEADWNGARHAAQGRIRLSLPPMPALQKQLGRELQVGDAIQAAAEVRDLERPTDPGERDESLDAILDGCWAEGRVRSPADVRLLRAPPEFPLARRITALRRNLLAHYETAFDKLGAPYPHTSAQLLAAMAFGEGGLIEPLPRRVRDDFRAAGMSHILVASGAQISFLCFLLIGASRIFGVRHWLLLLLLIPLLLAYALVAGGQSSIWRAAIAGICLALALLQGRDADVLSLWSLALIALLLVDPAQLFDIGFQLSFAATWGLIAIGPRVHALFERNFGRNAFSALAAFSLAAQAGVTPLLAYHFGRISLAGLGANLLGVPLAGVLVGSSLADLVLPLQLLHSANYLLADFIGGVASFAATLPGANLERPPLRLLWTATIYGALLLALALGPRGRWGKHALRDDIWQPFCYELGAWWRRRRLRAQTIVAALLILLIAGMGWRAWHPWSAQHAPLRVTMLDVGQGESILVRAPSGRSVLIDGGGLARFEREDVGGSVIVPYLEAMGVRRLDALVITHADSDHCNGLISVVREVPVGLVIDGAQQGEVTATEYLELRRALAERKIRVVAAHNGQRLNLGAGARMQVLAPLQPPFRGEHADNDNAAVLRLDYGKTSVLLTGDIERPAEERLVRRGANLHCTILKVAHHGSKTSTCEMLLRAAAPQAALISCGRYNPFGHPNAEVLRRLAQHHVATFRTDVSGAIEVSCDGQACWVQTQR
jgi:competence protein ComEC